MRERAAEAFEHAVAPVNDDVNCRAESRDGGPDRHFQARVPGPFDFRGHRIAARVLQDRRIRAAGVTEIPAEGSVGESRRLTRG